MAVFTSYENSVYYYQICQTHQHNLDEIERSQSDNKDEPSAKRRLEDERQKCEAIIIVFAVMCLEAFINDYGINRLSAQYMKKYIDKLGVVEKWVIVPQMVTSKDFRSYLGELPNLVKARNALVHPKPVVVKWGTEPLGSSVLGSKELSEIAMNSIQTVQHLVSKLIEIDDNSFNGFALIEHIFDYENEQEYYEDNQGFYHPDYETEDTW